ncbi:MAG: helix-turn-helix domain-containing protein [Burkholderiales bacterium]
MPLRCDILVYDDCLGSEAFAVRDTLWLANRLLGDRLFEPALVSVGARPVRCGGVEFRPVRAQPRPDVLIVPGMEALDGAELIARASRRVTEMRHIIQVARRGGRVGAVCVGAFLLAATGLLGGRTVTTAWALADALARQWPDVIVDSQAMVQVDGPFLTAGAMSAAFDLALTLVAERTGAIEAQRVRKFLALDAARSSQKAFSGGTAGPVARTDPIVDRAQRLLHETLDRGYDLTRLARDCGTSERTLLRRFRAVTGTSPRRYRNRLVIDMVKSLLEETTLPLSHIPSRLGYADAVALRRAFKVATGMTFKEHRRRFGILPAHQAGRLGRPA